MLLDVCVRKRKRLFQSKEGSFCSRRNKFISSRDKFFVSNPELKLSGCSCTHWLMWVKDDNGNLERNSYDVTSLDVTSKT